MNTVEELKNNPIFIMSLHSKELFHSNFWAWLLSRNSEYVKRVFGLDVDSDIQVSREQNHCDITIWKNKKGKTYHDAYIIENKFKSIPDKEQLLRYETNMNKNKNFCGGIITGLEEPIFMSDVPKWRYVSYKEIGENIIKAANEIEEDKESFIYNLIVGYGEMLCKLYDVLSNQLENIKFTWNPNKKKIANLSEIRIDDIFRKLLAEKLATYLRDNLVLKQNVKDYRIFIGTYWGQGKAGVDIRYVNEKATGDTPVVIGVQIEGNHYRICAQWKDSTNKNEKQRKDWFNQLKKIGWFVDYEYDKDKKINTSKEIYIHDSEKQTTGLKKDFCVFDSDTKYTYTFLYQYYKVNDIPFETICKYVQRDIDLAYKILMERIK